MREFLIEHRHGVIAGIEVHDVDDALDRLAPEDAIRARELKAARRQSFVAGRVALGRALAEVGAPATPIGANDRGAPVLPTGFAGSISHKGAVAVALAAPRSGEHLGVDVEVVRSLREGMAGHILTARERGSIAPSLTIAAFSIKEAIYKAIDPLVRRYVGFHEVELELSYVTTEFSVVPIRLLLPERLPPVEATVAEREGHILATARLIVSPPAAGCD